MKSHLHFGSGRIVRKSSFYTSNDLTQPPKRKSRSLRWVSNIMILLGLLTIPIIALKGITDYNLYNSPFDKVDFAEDSDVGFLPVLSISKSGLSLNAAPTLASGDAQSGLNGSLLGADQLDLESLKASAVYDRDELRQIANNQLLIPDNIIIPSIGVNAPIKEATSKEIPFWGKTYTQWEAPNSFAAGFHNTSAPLGRPGNTVLNGHQNIYGEIFRYLSDIERGSIIYLSSGDNMFAYEVNSVLILEEKYQSVEKRTDNAKWILPSQDERLTLISCWPYNSNTHRVIVIATPIAIVADMILSLGSPFD